MGSNEPKTKPWIGTKNQQKPKSEGKAPPVLEFSSHNIMSLYKHLYRFYYIYIFYVIIKQGAQDLQRKRRTVLKLLGRRSDLYLSYNVYVCGVVWE